MLNIPSISDAEWEVMKALWESAPLTAGQIVERVAAEKQWHSRTIKTLIGRLVRKGAVAAQVQGRSYLYRPKISQEACRREETRSFLDRVFDGNVAPALAHFLEEAELTPKQIAELRRILDGEKK